MKSPWLSSSTTSRQLFRLVVVIVLWMPNHSQTNALAIPDVNHLVTTTTTTTTSISSSSLSSSASHLFTSYQQALITHPLPTKMMTGVIVAIAGDAIAQGCVMANNDEEELCPVSYDSKRALAFAGFDAAYRAAQQVLYPPMIAYFQGQYVMGALMVVVGSSSSSVGWMENDHFTMLAGAMEQALVGQLVIIPTVYYPVFFAVTGAVQGLTIDETIQRAKDTFVPLMKRNLLFWIPVQFAVFAYCEESLQIPALTLCGLVWTVILSFVAGSVQPAQPAVATATAGAPTIVTNEKDNVILVVEEDEEDAPMEVIMADGKVYIEEEETYCVTGMEPHCLIDPDNLFRPAHVLHEKQQPQPAMVQQPQEEEEEEEEEDGGVPVSSTSSTSSSSSGEMVASPVRGE